MTAARKMDEDVAAREEHVADGARSHERERRCIVTGETTPDNRLIRFVVGPDDQIVPDVAAKLPGRGLWVTATRGAIHQAVEKKLFSRAAKAPANADAGLAERAEKALLARMVGDLGLARRAGHLVMGFDNVLRALESVRAPNLMIEASDGSGDGRRKLYNAAHARGMKPTLVDCLSSAELGLALGRENVIHAAVQPGGLADRLILDASRLRGLRDPSGNERDS